MGGTGAAVGSGFEAVHANPALLSLSHRRELTLGYLAARFSLHADGPNAPGDMHAPALSGAVIGATLPIPFGGALTDRVTLGMGFFTPSDVVVRGRILYPETPQFDTLADRTQSVAVQAGIGLDLGKGIRVGGGFAALAAISGAVNVATQANGQIGTTVDEQLVASYAPVVGAAYDLGDGWRAGATYRGVLEGRFAVTIYVHDLGSIVVPPFNIAGIAQYDPWQVQAEVARETRDWKLAAGATFKRWSAYPGAAEPTVLCPDDPDCQALVPPPVHFHDTVVPRIGADRRFVVGEGVALHARAGMFYEPSPAPEQTGESNYFDDDRVALTLGYGIELEGPMPPLDIDFALQEHYLVPRTHTKNADVPTANAGWPSVKTSGWVTMAALLVGVRF